MKQPGKSKNSSSKDSKATTKTTLETPATVSACNSTKYKVIRKTKTKLFNKRIKKLIKDTFYARKL